MSTPTRSAVVTGASAGIGAATARALAGLGYHVFLGARRLDRVEALAAELGGTALSLDVTDLGSVQAFAAAVPAASVLVNNAGLSRGLDPVETAKEAHWREMFETNVFGLLHTTQALLPVLSREPHAHVVNIGSIAGFDFYPNGGGYCGSKAAVRAITKALRAELLGRPIRVTEVNAGLVETEFSLVRFDGDAAAARKPYQGIDPLVAADIADCVAWAVSRPPHVNIDEIVVKPVRQGSTTVVSRRS